MPWKECSVMDERLQFVARRLAGEPTAAGDVARGPKPTAAKPSFPREDGGVCVGTVQAEYREASTIGP